jgi:hypothetical protein
MQNNNLKKIEKSYNNECIKVVKKIKLIYIPNNY